MSIVVTLDSSTSNLERTRALIDRSVDVVNDTIGPRVAPRMTRVAQEIIGSDPGPVALPIEWTSERQRRFVMALYRQKGITRYTRTGKYKKGYRVLIIPSPDGFLVKLINEVPYAAYVGGIWQQKFHANTGWVKASTAFAELAQIAELEISLILDELWGRR